MVEGDTLRNLPKDYDNLVTRNQFRDFELEFEWRLSPGGRSGIIYGSQNFSREFLLGDEGDGSKPKTTTGSLCHVIAPNQKTQPKPDGEFNRGRLTVDGNHVEHRINGAKVLEYELGSAELKSLVEQGPFKNVAEFTEPGPVSIRLEPGKATQPSARNVWFRNVRIRKLNSSPTAGASTVTPADSAVTPPPKTDFTSLFNGRDLSGWDGDPRFWSVREGAINAESPANGIVPKNTYLIWKGGTLGDFELRLSFKIFAGNSGVQYRSKVVDPTSWSVNGYQYEMDATNRFGNRALYEEAPKRKALKESGSGPMLANVGEKVRMTSDEKRQVTGTLNGIAQFRSGDWNELTITAQGNRLTHQLNGVTTIELTDDDVKARAESGVLALQLHGGSPQKVQFKDIGLKQIGTRPQYPPRKPAGRASRPPFGLRPCNRRSCLPNGLGSIHGHRKFHRRQLHSVRAHPESGMS